MYLGNVSGKHVIGGFDTIDRPLTVGIVNLCIYVLVMLVNNVANICFILHDKRLHKPMYLLISNLAVVDMLYSSRASPTIIGVLVAGSKTIAYVPCFIQMFVLHLGGAMEMFAISVMAFDHLIAITSLLRYQSVLTNVPTLVLTGALLGVAFAFVAVIPLPYYHSTLKSTFCDYAALVRATCVNPSSYFNMIIIVTFFLLFGTFCYICLSYLWIIFAIVKMSSKNDKRKIYSTYFSHLIVVVVVCHHVPLFVRVVLTRLGVVLTLEERHGLMIGAILGPSLVNPFVYCIRTKLNVEDV